MRSTLPAFVALLASLGASVSGCDFRSDKGETQPSQDAASWYGSVRERVFVPSCVSCHGTSGGVNLESYVWIKRNLDRIYEAAIVKKSMPRGGTLDPEASAMLAEWIEAGAPLVRPLNPSPTPSPSAGPMAPLDPLKLSYDLVDQKVFRPRCVSCHGNSGGVNLESYDGVSASLQAIEKTACEDRTMPKDAPLTSDQWSLLDAWLKAGAPKDPGAGPAPIPTETPTTSPQPVDPSELRYANLKNRIFAPKCVSCHGSSGAVNLESYASVQANLARIAVTVLYEKRMPQNAPLEQSDLNLLAAWIAAGAPEQAPEPDPLQPVFSSIQKKVLNFRCVTCHAPGGLAAGVPMQSLQDLLNSPRELVIPGDPDESGLVIAITRTDSKRMPPPSAGGPLSAVEVSIIRQWIKDGAKP